MILQGKHVFIVEDNVDNIYVILTLLRSHGAVVTVDWWATGECTRLLDAIPIDLIILDLMLPGNRSGYGVFDKIRTCPELAAIPVVAVSAADASVAIPIVQEKGFSGFISKPVDFHLFPEQIAAIIAGEQIWHTD